MASDFPAADLVRPGMLDWIPQVHVDIEMLWKVFVGSSLLVTERLFMRWRAYRQYALPIERTPSSAESLLEMDSPGSRLDGAITAAAAAAAPTEAAAAAAAADKQECQVCLNEQKISENKSGEKIAQFKHEMGRMKLGWIHETSRRTII